MLKLTDVGTLVIFSRFLAKFDYKAPHKNQLPWKRDNTSKAQISFPVRDSPNGLPKLKFLESAVLRSLAWGGEVGSTPPFRDGVGTKYLRTGRVNIYTVKITADTRKFDLGLGLPLIYKY